MTSSFSFTLQGSRSLSEPRACCSAYFRSPSCVNNSTSPPFLCWHCWQASTSARLLRGSRDANSVPYTFPASGSSDEPAS